jgi:hypothetical protein
MYNVFKQKYSDIPKVIREVIKTQIFWFSFILKSDAFIIVYNVLVHDFVATLLD